MTAGDRDGPAGDASKIARRAARSAVAAYHEAELGKLIERLRAGIAQYDFGEIDAFELDDLVHHYKRAAQKLYSFCTGSGGQIEAAARPLAWLRDQDELPNWWEEATPRRSAADRTSAIAGKPLRPVV